MALESINLDESLTSQKLLDSELVVIASRLLSFLLFLSAFCSMKFLKMVFAFEKVEGEGERVK